MADTQGSEPYVAAAVADLIFAARVRAAAEQQGVPLRFARTPGDVIDLGAGARLVLLDLDARWLDAPAAIAALVRRPEPPRVVAFVSHVREDAIEAALAAGADRVLPRSAFVKELPQLLRP
jgi:CheY-like chemotaxis protein